MLAVPNIQTPKKGGFRAGTRRFEDLTPDQKAVFATPAGFCRHVLGMKLYDQQATVMDAMTGTPSYVTSRDANESGKTSRKITGLILWHMAVFPRMGIDGGVISTSGSWRQLVNQLSPSLRSYQEKFPGYEFNQTTIVHKGVPQWMGFATNDAGKAEGFHGSPKSPLMALFDECKTVPDGVIDAVEDRCNPQRVGLFSSPGYMGGRFYESHTSRAQHYNGFKTATARFLTPTTWEMTGDSPHITMESVRRRIEKHGLDNPLVRSMIFAEFMDIVKDAPISLAQVEDCLENPPGFNQGSDRHCFLDFAAGGDENVIAFRQGNRVEIIDAWKDTNTMSAVGRFVIRLNELRKMRGLRPEETEGDASGLGKPMIDRLHEAGWRIGYAFNQEAARFDEHYANLASEVWLTGCDKIKAKSVIIPDDIDFKAQIINRKFEYHSKGLLRIEPKDKMKASNREGGSVPCSPDKAEAVLGALADCPHSGPRSLVQTIEEDTYTDSIRIPEGILAGAFAGC